MHQKKLRDITLLPTCYFQLFVLLPLTYNFSLQLQNILITVKDSPCAKARARTVIPSQHFVLISFFFLEFLAANLKRNYEIQTTFKRKHVLQSSHHQSTTAFPVFIKASTANGPFTGSPFRTVLLLE